jgi:hypothetical protein
LFQRWKYMRILNSLKLNFYKIKQKLFFDLFRVYFAAQHTQNFCVLIFTYFWIIKKITKVNKNTIIIFIYIKKVCKNIKKMCKNV